METINLKDKMFSELMTEIRTKAAGELAAFQAATAKLREIEALREQYAAAAADLRLKAKEPPPTGIDVAKIKSRLENRNQVTRKLQETEEAIKAIDETFLPGAMDELSAARDKLYAFINPCIFRHKAVHQQKVDILCSELNIILSSWDGALDQLTGEREIPVPSPAEKQTMADLTVNVKKDTPEILSLRASLVIARAARLTA